VLKLSFIFILLLSSCSTVGASNYLKSKISSGGNDGGTSKTGIDLTAKKFSDLSGWDRGDVINGFKAFSISCDVFLKRDDSYKIGGFAGYIYDWKDICVKAKGLNDVTKKINGDNSKVYKEFFESNFVPFIASQNNVSEGLFTGYYVPELRGSYTKTSKYKYPIYKKPIGKRNYSRSEVSSGSLDGKNLELIYVDDMIDLFFLHIQGSGRVRLDNNKVINVGYAGQNGYEYNSIGRLMVEDGIFNLEEVTAQKIKKWLRDNPKKIVSTLNRNPSYIYFKINKKKDAIGAQGLPLTPEGSLAIDKRYIPYGMPIWLDTEVNKGDKYQRLLVSQDTGGAIRGAVRGDIFFGFGKRAEEMAGKMRGVGKYYILLPKNIAYR